MSHSHTHAPGESHSHSHSPQPQQPPVPPPPDPALQALIDADFHPIPLALNDERTLATCAAHGLEACTTCDVDFINLNRLSALLAANPHLLCPPPANVVSQKLSQAVTGVKDEGNHLFKLGLHPQAISRYTIAAATAVQRPPWEANQLMREELSTVLSNRSAAYFEAHDYDAALADADAVITLRRGWSKGHFRKAKALLGLTRFDDAIEAVRLGLAFEPNNAELNTFLADIERVSRLYGDAKAKARESKREAAEPAAVTA